MTKLPTDRDMPYPDDNLRAPDREGEPPRPATEPPGAERSAQGPHTETDPATGEPLSRERGPGGHL